MHKRPKNRLRTTFYIRDRHGKIIKVPRTQDTQDKIDRGIWKPVKRSEVRACKS